MAEEERLFCRTFRPTKEEFSQPFCDYVQEICRKNPDVAMFKVIPPVSWAARRERMPDLEEMRIETPIRQHVRLGAICSMASLNPLSKNNPHC